MDKELANGNRLQKGCSDFNKTRKMAWQRRVEVIQRRNLLDHGR